MSRGCPNRGRFRVMADLFLATRPPSPTSKNRVNLLCFTVLRACPPFPRTAQRDERQEEKRPGQGPQNTTEKQRRQHTKHTRKNIKIWLQNHPNIDSGWPLFQASCPAAPESASETPKSLPGSAKRRAKRSQRRPKGTPEPSRTPPGVA